MQIFMRSYCDTGQSRAMQSAAAVALMPLLIFAYTAAVSHNAFQWVRKTLKIAPPLGDLDPL